MRQNRLLLNELFGLVRQPPRSSIFRALREDVQEIKRETRAFLLLNEITLLVNAPNLDLGLATVRKEGIYLVEKSRWCRNTRKVFDLTHLVPNQRKSI